MLFHESFQGRLFPDVMQEKCPNAITLQSSAFGREGSHKASGVRSPSLQSYLSFSKSRSPQSQFFQSLCLQEHPVTMTWEMHCVSPRGGGVGRPAGSGVPLGHAQHQCTVLSQPVSCHTSYQGEETEPPSAGFLRNFL